MKILLTGFEPFDCSPVNPSEQVVRALAQQPPAGIALATAVLPVDRQRGPQALLAALAESEPQAVICLGEARRRSAISLERVAVNLLDFSIPDNQGILVVDESIVPAGPAAYFSTLPLRRMLEAVRAAGIPAELSLSAGSYLCNQVMYTLLDDLKRRGLVLPAGFIHLPALPEQALDKPGMPSMSLATMIQGIRAALLVLIGGD
jgi:pyroglutamyl-peptidase